MHSSLKNITRRQAVKSVALGGTALTIPTYLRAQDSGFTNAPSGNEVTFGFPIPQTGPYAAEGVGELRAYELAIEHLNGGGDGGMLNTFSSKALDGTGILGRKVNYVAADTQTNASVATDAARSMIQNDGAIMISGGVSSSVAVAVQSLCQEAGVIFMAAQTASNDTTGVDRKANGFRHFYNSYMIGAALAPVLANTYGADRKAYYLTADYNWGYTTEEAITSSTEALGWETVRTVRTPLSQNDFSPYLAAAQQSDANVFVLSHYGGNMIDSLQNAADLSLRSSQVNGQNVEIVVPILGRLAARSAGDNIKGIYGTLNWHWSLQDEGSLAFVRSYGTKYGFPPGQADHSAYVQTLLYADAVTRAGSFAPCAVAEALEDFEFDGMGDGPTLYRGADHQCFKQVLVARGKENPVSDFDLLEVVEIIPAEQVTYAADHPQMGGSAATLGACNNGA